MRTVTISVNPPLTVRAVEQAIRSPTGPESVEPTAARYAPAPSRRSSAQASVPSGEGDARVRGKATGSSGPAEGGRDANIYTARIRVYPIRRTQVSDTEQNPNGTMQSVLRSLSVLEAVAEMQPVGLSRLARVLELPKGTVSRILKTLNHAGWVAPEGDPGEVRWIITARALAVGARVMNQVDLREIARPIITQLGNETDENIHLSVPDGNMLVLVDKVHSSRSVQTVSQIGQRAPMYLTASGWAFLSRLDPADVETYLPERLVTAADSVIEREELMLELALVRERGYAINPGRWRSDVGAIASAVVDRAGNPIAALSISLPSYRLVPDLYQPYGELVRTATAKLASQL